MKTTQESFTETTFLLQFNDADGATFSATIKPESDDDWVSATLDDLGVDFNIWLGEDDSVNVGVYRLKKDEDGWFPTSITPVATQRSESVLIKILN